MTSPSREGPLVAYLDELRLRWQERCDQMRGLSEEAADVLEDAFVEEVTEELRGMKAQHLPELRSNLLAHPPEGGKDVDIEVDLDEDWSVQYDDVPEERTFEQFVLSLLVPAPTLVIEDPAAFRESLEIRLSAAELPLSPAVLLHTADVLAGVSQESGLIDYGGSWFAGRPLMEACGEAEETAPWPTGADGSPLAHLVQVNLTSLTGEAAAKTGLPDSGLLQFFHDLRDDGTKEVEGPRGWAVRHLQIDPDDARVAHPADPEVILGRPRALEPDTATTAPARSPVGDLGAEKEARYSRARRYLEWNNHLRNALHAPRQQIGDSPWGPDQRPLAGVSRLTGYPALEPDTRRQHLLADGQVVLLADLDLAAVLGPDHASPARRVEYWIRRSDLASGHFDDAWAYLR